MWTASLPRARERIHKFSKNDIDQQYVHDEDSFIENVCTSAGFLLSTPNEGKIRVGVVINALFRACQNGVSMVMPRNLLMVQVQRLRIGTSPSDSHESDVLSPAEVLKTTFERTSSRQFVVAIHVVVEVALVVSHWQYFDAIGKPLFIALDVTLRERETSCQLSLPYTTTAVSSNVWMSHVVEELIPSQLYGEHSLDSSRLLRLLSDHVDQTLLLKKLLAPVDPVLFPVQKTLSRKKTRHSRQRSVGEITRGLLHSVAIRIGKSSSQDYEPINQKEPIMPPIERASTERFVEDLEIDGILLLPGIEWPEPKAMPIMLDSFETIDLDQNNMEDKIAEQTSAASLAASSFTFVETEGSHAAHNDSDAPIQMTLAIPLIDNVQQEYAPSLADANTRYDEMIDIGDREALTYVFDDEGSVASKNTCRYNTLEKNGVFSDIFV